jgi:glycosyltransferase involved in cell wall biosynthesis
MIGFARGFTDWARTVPARERPEVVVGSSPHLIAAVAAGRASRLMGSKFVAEVRDIWPESLVDLGVSRWHPFVIWMGALERRLHGLADGLVTLLPKSVAYFEGRGVPRERICVVPNGIDLDEAPTDPRSEEPTDGFTVVYAGAHGVANGLDTLLDAAKLLRDEPVLFQLYGDGPERPRLANRVKAEGIVNVELKGAVPKAEVHGALRSAGAGLLVLSKMDVFRYGISPNKLFDYLAMGLPVVVSVDADLGGLGDCPAVVQTPAGDGKALAEAVRLLSKEDPCERRARGDQGRAFVEAHHDFKVLARRYSEFLTQIVAGAVPQSTENLR